MAKALNIDLNVNANTSLARQELSLLQSMLKQLTSASGEISRNLTTGMDLSKTIAQVTELRALLQSATNVDTGVLNFTKLNQSILSANTSLAEYGKTLNSLGPSGQRAFLLLATAVSKSEIPIGQANGMLKQFGTTMKNTLRWQASSMLLHGAMNSILKAWNYAQKLDRSLTDIQIVTKQSDAQMAKFAENANRAARALSTSTTAYTDAALIYYQLGLNDTLVKQRTDVTVKMANVTGRTAEKVSDQMTAIWNNFDNGSKSLEYYADVITALGAATASSSDEIATGLSKFAAVADTVGLSYENATAALATITATTRQSADSVGNGLKTLFSRLQSLSLGKTLEDGVNLTKYTKALNTVGVSALDAAGNLRSMDSILADLGERWGSLSAAQLNALAQTVGGVRLYVTFTALMDNYDFFKDNIQIAKSAAGELLKQADVYDKSWAAARKHVQASAEAIYSDLIDDKFFTSLTNGFAGLLHLVDNFIDGIGGIKGVLLSAGAAFANFNKLGMQSFFLNTINGILTFLPGGAKRLLDKRDETLNQFLNMLLNPTIKNAKGEDIEVGFASLESQYRAEGIARNLRLQQDYLEKSPYMTDALRLAALMYMEDIASRGEEVAGLAAKIDRSLIARDDAQIAFRSFRNKKIDMSKALGSETRNELASRLMGDVVKGDAYKALIDATEGSISQFEAALRTSGIKTLTSGTDLNKQTEIIDKLLANPAYNNNEIYRENLATLRGAAAAGNYENYNAQVRLMFGDTIAVMRDNAIDQVIKEMKTKGLLAGGNDAESTAKEAEARQSLEKVYKTNEQVLEDELRLGHANGELGDLRTAALPDMLKLLFGTALGLTEVSGMLMNFGMGLSTLKGALDTLKNDDIATGDKIMSLMTSFGFGLPMVLKGVKDFTDSGIVKALGEQSLINKTVTLGLGGQAIKSYKTLKDGSRLYRGIGEDGADGNLFRLDAADIPSDKIIRKTGLLKAGGYAAIIGAMIAATAVIADIIVTPLEKLDELNHSLEISKNIATEAAESYSNLSADLDNHNKALSLITDLTQGTLAYRLAVLANNNLIKELANTYKIEYQNNNGVYQIDKATQDKILEQQMTQAENASFNQSALLNLTNVLQITADLVLMRKTILNPLRQGTVSPYETYANLFNLSEEELRKADEQHYNLIIPLSTMLIGSGSSADLAAAQFGADFATALLYIYGQDTNLEKTIWETNSQYALDMALTLQEVLYDNEGSDLLNVMTEAVASDYDLINEAIANATRTDETVRLGELETLYREAYGNDAFAVLLASEEYSKLADKEKKKYLGAQVDAKNLLDTLEQAVKDIEQSLQKANVPTSNLISWQSLTLNELSDNIKEIIKNLPEGDEYQNIRKFLTDSLLGDAAEIESAYEIAQQKLGLSLENSNELNLRDKLSIALYANTFSETFGENTASTLMTTLSKDSKLLKAFSKINISGNAIADMFEIKSAASIIGKDFSDKLIQEMRTDLSDADLFRTLFEDSSFLDIRNELSELVQSGQGIKASDISKLVSSNTLLKQYLSDTGMNTGGLAQLLGAIFSGNINSSQLSANLVKAYQTAGANGGVTAEAYLWASDYEEGPDNEDIDKVLLKMEKDLYADIKNGNYLNGTSLSAIEYLGGEAARLEWEREAAKAALKPTAAEADAYMKSTDVYKTYVLPLMDMYKAQDVSTFYKQIIDQYGDQAIQEGSDVKLKDIFTFDQNGYGMTINDELFFKAFSTTQDWLDYLINLAGGTYSEGLLKTITALYFGENGANQYASYRLKLNDAIAGLTLFTGQNAETMSTEEVRAYLTSNEGYLSNPDLTDEDRVKILLNLGIIGSNVTSVENDKDLYNAYWDENGKFNINRAIVSAGYANNNIISLGPDFNNADVNTPDFINAYNRYNQNDFYDLLGIKSQKVNHEETIPAQFIRGSQEALKYAESISEIQKEIDAKGNASYFKMINDGHGGSYRVNGFTKLDYDNAVKAATALMDREGMFNEGTKTVPLNVIDYDKLVELLITKFGRTELLAAADAEYIKRDLGLEGFTRLIFDIASGTWINKNSNDYKSTQDFLNQTELTDEDLQELLDVYNDVIHDMRVELLKAGGLSEEDQARLNLYIQARDNLIKGPDYTDILEDINMGVTNAADAAGTLVDQGEAANNAGNENLTGTPEEGEPTDESELPEGEESEPPQEQTQLPEAEEKNPPSSPLSINPNPNPNPTPTPGKPTSITVTDENGITATFTGDTAEEDAEKWLQERQQLSAAGLNNHIPGFASGYQGPATVGELGPETWIHNGQMDIVGLSGRETIWVNPSDTILTAGQTSRLLEGHNPGFSGGWRRGGSGGGTRRGSGSGGKEEDEEKWKDSWEPYHEISREVQRLTTDVENLNTEMERAFGVEKIQKMEEELDLLDLRLLQEADYIAEAEAYIAEYEQYLPDGTEVVDGVILNYDALLEQYLKDIYDAAKNGKKDKLEELQREWLRILTYEQHTDKLEERRQEQLNLLYQKADLMLQQLLYSIDLVNSSLDESENLIDYMLNHMNTDMFKMAESIALVGDATDVTIQKMELAKQSIQDYEDMLGTEYANDEELVNSILQERNNLLKLNQELDKQRDNVIKKLTYTIQEFNNELKKATKLLTNYNTLIKNYTDLSELMGLSTINNTEQIDKLNDALKNNMGLNIQATKSQLETNQALIAQMEANFEANPWMREAYDDVYQKLIEEGQGLSVTLSNNLQSMLNFIVKEFETELDRALTSFQDQITKGFGTWDELTSAANSLKGAQDVNTKAYDRVYQLNTLIRDMDSYMNDMTSAKNHNSILKFQELIKKLKADNTDLSQEELDVLRAQFELMLAQFDLEDAQNAKNQVRLQRDMNGNWGYVYTADEDAMAEAQLNVDDKLKAYLDAVTALLQVQGEYMGTVAELEIQEQELRNELNQLGHTDEDEERRALLLKLIAELENLLSIYRQSLDRMEGSLNDAIEIGRNNINEIWDENVDLQAALKDLPMLILAGQLTTVEEFFNTLGDAEGKFIERTDAAKDAYMEQYEEWAPYLEEFNNGLGNMAELSQRAVENLDALNELYLQEFTDAMKAAVDWEKEYGIQMEAIVKLNLIFIDLLDQMINGLRGLDSMDYSVSFRRVTDDSEVSAMTSMDSGGYTGAWGTSGKIAMLHEKEQVFNAQDTLNLLTAALILRTIDASANSMAIGLNNMITPKINGVTQQVDLTVNISASFPNAVNHFEIEEAFNNLTNKAVQFANRKNA